MIQRLLWVLVVGFLLYSLGLLAWRSCVPGQVITSPPIQAGARPSPTPVSCLQPAALFPAALRNGQSRDTAAWSAFGRPETGWAIYEPLIAHEIGSPCPADSAAFAQALASWQVGHGLKSTGEMDQPTLSALRLVWLSRRPFVAQSEHQGCPAPPPASALVLARPDEGYGSKPIQLLPQALAAWRKMAAAARLEVPVAAADRRLLTIFSGYRDPVADAVRCATGEVCGTIAKALCSAHRTGLAMDLYLGAAPGYDPASSADANRLYLSRTPTYHWLVANAGRFGFVNYPFEPWHWEYVGHTLH
ncbi:MAG TPA: M15 family metallopeptidase [Caulobacteraceae bacterium]|jgi:hypothetical protein